MISAFGVSHGGEISKAEPDHVKRNDVLVGTAATGAGVGGAALVATKTNMPEHSHYSKKTRKYIQKLPAGVHEVDTKMLAHRPRKLGARKQQAPYVAAMARERPAPYSPVPITRYKDGVIQRDNAHSVMANAMKGRKTLIKIEDAPGYRPSRRTGEEVVRRAQMRYQQHRLKQHFDLSDKKIKSIADKYTDKSRKANTSKRPHGVVEEGFKHAEHPFGVKRALGLVRKDRNDMLAGGAGAAGVGVLASTPVRRSAPKVKIKDGRMSASDARKVVSPGYRPGNKRAIKVLARNLGHLEDKPSTVIQYKDGRAISFDGSHRATARLARGDKSLPYNVVEGGERPAISVARNVYHSAGQRLHQEKLDRGHFKPDAKPESKGYTGKHAGETKPYKAIANGSTLRSGRRVAVGSTRLAAGPTNAMLHGRQAATVLGGAALLGGAYHLHNKKDIEKRDRNLSQDQIDRKKKTGAQLTRTTSIIGLGSLAALGGVTAVPKLAASGKLVRIAPKLTPEKAKAFKYAAKSKLLTAGIVSSGIGGFNGLNNASWQEAESRQRKQNLAKSAPSPFEDGFYGTTTDVTTGDRA